MLEVEKVEKKERNLIKKQIEIPYNFNEFRF